MVFDVVPSHFLSPVVLTELLTESELYSLSLPATTSLRCRADEDEVDLTTEELLAIPSDGSLPVTKTTAYLTGGALTLLSHLTSYPYFVTKYDAISYMYYLKGPQNVE